MLILAFYCCCSVCSMAAVTLVLLQPAIPSLVHGLKRWLQRTRRHGTLPPTLCTDGGDLSTLTPCAAYGINIHQNPILEAQYETLGFSTNAEEETWQIIRSSSTFFPPVSNVCNNSAVVACSRSPQAHTFSCLHTTVVASPIRW